MTLKTFSRSIASTAIVGSVLLSSAMIPVVAFAQAKVPVTSPTPQTGTPPTTTPAPANGAPAADPAATAAPDNTHAPAQFIPLTQLPGLTNTATTSTLPGFLNSLYKICIGAAAVIAVLEIMFAGVQFMTSRGSVTSNEAAKSRIQNAIFGLVLVLSPTIVFKIINPSILNLDLNFSKLDPSMNKNSSGKVDTAAAPVTGAPTGECTAAYTAPKAVPGTAANVCSTADAAYAAAPTSCCKGMSAGNTCCAKPASATTPPTTTPPATGKPSSPPAVTPAPAPAADVYAWAVYTVPRGRTSPDSLASKGPFPSTAACNASFQSFFSENNVDVSGNKAPLCICSTKVSAQPGCRY